MISRQSDCPPLSHSSCGESSTSIGVIIGWSSPPLCIHRSTLSPPPRMMTFGLTGLRYDGLGSGRERGAGRCGWRAVGKEVAAKDGLCTGDAVKEKKDSSTVSSSDDGSMSMSFSR